MTLFDSRTNLSGFVRRHVPAMLALACVSQVGCVGLLYSSKQGATKRVEAECDKLAGQRVAVVVWAEPSTLDVYPFSRYQTAEQILLWMSRSNEKELKGTTFIPTYDVNKLQEQLGAAGPTMTENEIGEKLKADMVMRIDLYEFTTRAPEANGLIKGRVSGNISVHRVGQASALYRTEISAEYPDSPMGLGLDATDDTVLNQTLLLFGERVSRKFHRHEVRLDEK